MTYFFIIINKFNNNKLKNVEFALVIRKSLKIKNCPTI